MRVVARELGVVGAGVLRMAPEVDQRGDGHVGARFDVAHDLDLVVEDHRVATVRHPAVGAAWLVAELRRRVLHVRGAERSHRLTRSLRRTGTHLVHVVGVDPGLVEVEPPAPHGVARFVGVRRAHEDVVGVDVGSEVTDAHDVVVEEPDAVDGHQHERDVAVLQGDGARPLRIAHTRSRPPVSEAGDPDAIEVAVAVHVGELVSVGGLVATVAVRIDGQHVDALEARRHVDGRGPHHQGPVRPRLAPRPSRTVAVGNHRNIGRPRIDRGVGSIRSGVRRRIHRRVHPRTVVSTRRREQDQRHHCPQTSLHVDDLPGGRGDCKRPPPRAGPRGGRRCRSASLEGTRHPSIANAGWS